MSVITKTQRESQIESGKVFDFLISDTDVDNGNSIDIVICTNNNTIELDSITIEGNVETSNWQAFVQPVFTGGTVVQPIPKNLVKTKPLSAQITLNPTITSDGTPFFVNPIDLVAEQRGNNAYMSERILSSHILPDGGCYLVRVTNTSGANKRIDANITVAIR